jgi:NTP pyrophosphatase (non-canonical NTP hydrolase)|tara:strand:+ start:506 stop:877 length:372 start_codon:yes stop_codon:yes gene_type:complete
MKNSNLLGDKMNIEKINNEIIKFVEERDWEKFHTPKNISMALSVEASELLEIFQWHDDDSFNENKEKLTNLSKDEVADIFYYLLRMCQILEIDLEKVFFEKMKKNVLKYPKEKYQGKSTWENN